MWVPGISGGAVRGGQVKSSKIYDGIIEKITVQRNRKKFPHKIEEKSNHINQHKEKGLARELTTKSTMRNLNQSNSLCINSIDSNT